MCIGGEKDRHRMELCVTLKVIIFERYETEKDDSVKVTHTISVIYWAHLCMKYSLGICNFLGEISSLFHSLFSSISLHWTLRKAVLSLLAILWNSAFKWIYLSFSPLLLASLLFIAICKASSDSDFAFLHFYFLGMVLLPVSCTVSWTSTHSSPSLIIREMQIKTTMWYSFTPVWIDINKNSTSNNSWRECEEKGTLLNFQWACKCLAYLLCVAVSEVPIPHSPVKPKSRLTVPINL